MKTKIKSIGSFEAKTHLSSLIEYVQNGGEYIITKRGKPVARLILFRDQEKLN
jgi:prevent-host-death family protein